ncbi:glycosyltransferase family 4 protein [Magnetofaba australis]|uniref:Putative group 1 glycosyl transferase n=1 Tax=Magnetofaba australis IT-1 TaxID=1434232 RepID=A0A1Y2JZV6_9PROT|nr:glycosyltransferase family 4 protein [Magnetofaba australis]OSM00074.1 putative group 1 glycosyl transferase [Magnetofaba australis IT-1]
MPQSSDTEGDILIVTREIPPIGGGAGNVAWDLAKGYAELGRGVDILTMGYGDLPATEQRDGVTVHRVDCARRQADSSYMREMLRFVLNGPATLKKLAAQRAASGKPPYAAIHAHAIIPDGLLALLAGRMHNAPVIVTAHGSDVPGYNPTYFLRAHQLLKPVWMAAMRRYASVVTPSCYLRGLIHQRMPNAEVMVIPYGIDPQMFSPPGERNDAFLIASRLVERKNFQLFFDALSRIDAPQTVHVVGEGPMLERLKQMAASMPQHEITFHGWLANRSEPWRALYESCRYLIFPSERENFPVSLMEAQLAGMTVLASDIPGNREVMGDAALYFPELSAEGIETTLRAVLNGDLDAAAYVAAQEGRARMIHQFSRIAIAKRYLALFDRLAAGESAQEAA